MKEHPELIEVRKSKIEGTGVFAVKKIPKGTYILQYKGLVIDKKEAEKEVEKGNNFIFILDNKYDLNGNVKWNDARFINHSCNPNCESEIDEQNGIWISSVKQINQGEELTFNYGYPIEDYKYHKCKCGSPNCVGYIVSEDYFDKIKNNKI